MKEKYTYLITEDNSRFLSGCLVLFLMFGIPSTVGITAGIIANSNEIAVAALILTFFIVFFIMTGTSSAEFEADKTMVTFRYPFRKTVIVHYNYITDMKLERRCIDGRSRYYMETLTITAGGKEYTFSEKLDIDYDKAAEDPASLQEQFDNSKFSKLKRYIEDCMGIVSRS